MMLFKWGWFTEPLIRGDYPATVQQHFWDQLPVLRLLLVLLLLLMFRRCAPLH
jgi:hypothetical protein